jgi:DNA-binding transcriptional regulator YhcF (GntR family)
VQLEKKLPFSVDRERSVSLTAQIVDGVRQAVQTGAYKPGDLLPGFREIAKELGVCLIVVRSAFSRLAAEGIVCRRRGVVSVVMEPEKKLWRGHIVIASIEIRENHLLSGITGELRQDLMKAGYLVSTVVIGTSPGNYDFSHLESVLSGSVTLVVSTSCFPEIEQFLSRFKTPYIVFGDSKKAVGRVKLDCTKAVTDFVRYCRANKVKRVLEITVGSKAASAREMLAKAHIECKSWPIVRKGGIEDILRATLAAFYRKMERYGRAWLPDVLYFNDNFAAQSALIALLESNVDIPGEVRFVTWSNRGEGPFWRKELTRIEIDPFESGRIFARYVLKYLSGRKIPEDTAVSPVFVAGES